MQDARLLFGSVPLRLFLRVDGMPKGFEDLPAEEIEAKEDNETGDYRWKRHKHGKGWIGTHDRILFRAKFARGCRQIEGRRFPASLIVVPAKAGTSPAGVKIPDLAAITEQFEDTL